jgi:hypothetical protein
METPSMYDPFAVPPGVMQTTAVPQVMPNPVPVRPTLSPNNALAAVAGPRPMGPPNRMAFMQAIQDWRGQRPQFAYDPTLADPMKLQRQDFRNTLMDWRQQRPDRRTFTGGIVPPIGG